MIWEKTMVGCFLAFFTPLRICNAHGNVADKSIEIQTAIGGLSHFKCSSV
jgi:hypothetical protein